MIRNTYAGKRGNVGREMNCGRGRYGHSDRNLSAGSRLEVSVRGPGFVPKYCILKPDHVINRLPVFDRADEINAAINNPLIQVIVLESPTGSGKSVGAPVLIAEQGKKTIVSLPTRLAVRGLNSYLTSYNARNPYDFGFACHGEVRYTTTRDPVTGAMKFQTKVMYVTTMHAFNVLMKRMSEGVPFDDDFVLSIDEAHHTSEENAGIILLAKEALRRGILKKLVIMSATLGSMNFDEFTSVDIRCEGRLFPIDVIWGTGKIELLDPNSAKIMTVNKVVDIITEHLRNPRKGILVFTPGANEAEEMATMLENFVRQRGSSFGNIVVHRLYSEMQKEEMEMVTNEPEMPGKTIVVFTTNVAESSVTIKYIDTVVDMGTQKTSYENPTFGTILKLEEIPKDKALQRRGRGGRLHPGKCYLMYSESQFNSLKDTDTSDLERKIPYTLVLKLLDVGLPAKEILEIPEDKFAAIVMKLTRLKIMDERLRVTPFGREILKYNMSLESSVIAHSAISSSNEVVKLLSIIILAMIEGGQGMSYFWVPRDRRSPEDRKDYMEYTFGDMKGSNDLVTLIYIFSEMFHRPVDRNGRLSHTDGSISHWAKVTSMNNKLLTNARKSFSRLAHMAYPDSNCRFWSDYVEIGFDVMPIPEFLHGECELKDFCNHTDAMNEIYRLFEKVYFDCGMSNPRRNKFGILCYTHTKTGGEYTMDTNRGFSDMASIPCAHVVALQLVTSESGIKKNRFCSLVFPGTGDHLTSHTCYESESDDY